MSDTSAEPATTNSSTSPAPCAQSAVSGEERQCEDIRSAGPEAQSSERRGSSEQLGVTARRDGIESINWPVSRGEPSKPTWSYGGNRKLHETAALRLFAHDLVERIRQLELPVRQAMKEARGDGLDALAYCRMMQRRLDGMTRERDRLQSELTELRRDLAREANARVVMLAELNAAQELAVRQGSEIKRLQERGMCTCGTNLVLRCPTCE